jgi:PQQ-dependent dehydrogenase (methanol/ethanol family)
MWLLVLLFISLSLSAQELPRAYRQYCAACHGEGGAGTDRGPNLIDTRSLRSASVEKIRDIIAKGTGGGMPAFDRMPAADLEALTAMVRTWNASAYDAAPGGDQAAGQKIFESRCLGCHSALGQGGANGPDLSNIGRELTLREIEAQLNNPNSRIGKRNAASCPSWAFCPDNPWAVVKVSLADGRNLRGFARARGAADLQLQTFDGKLHLLAGEMKVEPEKGSYMPAVKLTAEEKTNLLAYLSRLGGTPAGPLKKALPPPSTREMSAVQKPPAGDWPGYHGLPSGNRHSELKQVNAANAQRLQLKWSYSLPHMGLQTTPLAVDGVLYVTAPNQVCALAGDTGREIWCYTRPRSDSTKISGDAAKGAQRGAAMLGDKIFFATDDAHLIALNRLTGALVWQVFMPEGLPGAYGATAAPLVVGDLVIAGIGGGDAPLRGFLAAYRANSGEEAWRFWTIPKRGEPGSETWQGTALEVGGGATWLTGSYDPGLDTLYWPIGNPYPDTDGSQRQGDNLYTDSVVALEPKTGKLKWHFQFTPHDLWDWDATEPLVLVDEIWQGKPRKLLLQANRNGYFYVLDRVTGEFLLGTPFVKRLTWAKGLTPQGRPIVNEEAKPTMGGTVVCPAVRGATNWYATAYNPETKLFYVMAVEDCNLYRQAGSWFVPYSDPANPPVKLLRALDIQTGRVVWEQTQVGAPEANYTGVLSTAGGLLFYGESGGTFAAADARTGKTLWRFPTNTVWKASPMTYLVHGKQHVAIAAGSNILSFALVE